MKNETLAPPAKTYQLNVLASALGRFAIPDLDGPTRSQANEMLDRAIDCLAGHDTPEVPHTNPALLGEASKFDARLLRQVEKGPASAILTDSRKSAVRQHVSSHREYCDEALEGNAGWEMLADPQDIAEAYRLPGLLSNPSGTINEEIRKWRTAAVHPEIVSPLRSNVGAAETSRLLDLMWKEVIGLTPEQAVNVRLIENPADYHVYWTPTASGLDYATPADYDRATQLSFDIPHNAAHLAHLDAQGQEAGACRYDDSMAQRAYFEAVAVLSEYACVQTAHKDKDLGAAIADIYGLDSALWGDAISEWVVKDRAYEFKLRTVRYAADVLMVSGMDLNEAAREMSGLFDIPEAEVRKESLKYIPWTGLGATYTYGYRKLLSNGVENVRDAVYLPDGAVKVSW